MSRADRRPVRRKHGGVMSSSAGYQARRIVITVLTLAVVVLTTALPSSASDTPATAGRGSSSFWHPLSGKPASAGRTVDIKATNYRAFSLDRGAMKVRLTEAPSDRTQAAAAPLVLSLPAPNGGFERFAVQESPVVAPALAARFPFIKTYAGQGIDDPSATVRLDLGRTGFHAQILSAAGDWYIDPIFRLDQSAYASYFEKSLVNTHGAFVERGPQGGADGGSTQAADRVVGTQLRTYRLALAADGEYSTFHGGTVPLVHNALVTAVNRVTGIYERDLAIRLQLVANNDSLIYLNPSTDPYTNNNPGRCSARTRPTSTRSSATRTTTSATSSRRVAAVSRGWPSSAGPGRRPVPRQGSRTPSATPSTSTTSPTRWATSSGRTTRSARRGDRARATATAPPRWNPAAARRSWRTPGSAGTTTSSPSVTTTSTR